MESKINRIFVKTKYDLRLHIICKLLKKSHIYLFEDNDGIIFKFYISCQNPYNTQDKYYKEIGYLSLRYIDVNNEEKQLQIDDFAVKEIYRKSGIGKCLFILAKRYAKKHNIHSIIVYPYPDPYPGDSYVSIDFLYKIYKKLGFSFENTDLNNKNYKNISSEEKMILYI